MQQLDGICPRCGGVLQAMRDDYGPYVRCLNCGRHVDLLQPSPEQLDLLKKVASHNDRHRMHPRQDREYRYVRKMV